MTAGPPASPAAAVAPLLYARLQVSAPEARSILLAWPTSDDGPSLRNNSLPLASALADAYRSAGINTALLSLPPESERLLTVDELRNVLADIRLTVVEGRGVLDSPNTILAVRAVDVVVVLARQGRTRRSDLESAGRELRSAGASVAGAVLIH